jgi:large conductance mechanosensitive channel
MNRGTGIAREFKEFLARGNVVELAVAVVIGSAFGAVIASLVSDLLTPLIAAIFGKQDFSSLTFTINDSKFFYGSFVNALITFVTVAAAVFFFVVRPVNALMARRAAGIEPEPEAPSDEVKLLTEIRDLLQTRS